MPLEPACAETQECGAQVKEETEEEAEGHCSVEIKVEFEEGVDGQREESIEIEVDFREETYEQQPLEVHIKEEPEWMGDLDWSLKSNVKESGLKVEGDLVQGPEGPQLPDSAFDQTASACPSDSEASTLPRHRTCPTQLTDSSRSTEHLKHRSVETETHQLPPSSSTTAHERTNGTAARPYSCGMCMKQFASQCSLLRHERTHTGEKPFSCDKCVKKFTLKHHLNAHMLTHTDEKPYSCAVCTKQFTLKHHLVAHMRTHTGEKPYSCGVCTKQFAHRHSYAAHQLTHTGEKRFSCEVCTKQFRLKHHLVGHMKRAQHPLK